MKRIVLILLFVSFAGLQVFSQSCPNAVIYDSTNNVVASGITIQLTCDMPFVKLAPSVFAPGASSGYVVESIPYAPPCPYTISPNAVDYILPADDVWGSLMHLSFGQNTSAPDYKPFIFSFYGQNNLNACVIGSNGLLSWDQTVASGVDFMTNNASRVRCEWSLPATPIPTPGIYTNCIFGPYHDIDFNAVGGIGQMYFEIMGEYPCRKIILSFENVPMFQCNDMRAYHMIVLYETSNTIEFYMQNKPLCSSWNSGKAVLGIQNAAGTEATVVSNYNLPTQWSATNEAWRIRPSGDLNSSTQWFRRPASGGSRVPLGSNENFEIIANPTSNDGDQWYIMETSIIRLDGEELFYYDSCLVKPIDLPAFLISHNSITEDTIVICKGSGLELNLSGGNNYRMIAPTPQDVTNPNSINVSPTINTTYIFEVDNLDPVTNVLICTRRDSVLVMPRSFSVDIGESKTICQNDTLTITNLTPIDMSGSSQWYYDINSPIHTGDSLSFAPQSTGYLYMTLTDSLSCKATDSVLITVNNSPVVNISGTTTICSGASTLLTANSSLNNCTYLWNTGETTASVNVTPTLSQTTYRVSVKYSSAECETIDSIVVNTLDKPIVNASTDVNICYSDSAQIYVSGNANTYSWTAIPHDNNVEGNTSTNLTVYPLESTMYIVKGENQIGCVNSDTVSVFVSALPQARMSLNPSMINDLDPTVVFQDQTDGSVIRRWNLSDETSSNEQIFVHTFELSDTTQSFLVSLYVENIAGCRDSLTNVLRIAKTHHLWAPNAVYVYDSDPRISQFRVYIDDPMDFELKIFNRWGECVFETDNQEKAWDCTYKGQLVPQGAYVWIAKYKHRDKQREVITDKGTINVYK